MDIFFFKNNIDFTSNKISSAVFSDDGELLAVATIDSGIHIYETQTWSKIKIFYTEYAGVPEDADYYRILDFSSDSNMLAVAYKNYTHIYHIFKGSLIQNLSGHSSGMRHVSFSPNGAFLVTAAGNYQIKLWNVSDWTSRDITLPVEEIMRPATCRKQASQQPTNNSDKLIFSENSRQSL